MTNRNLRAAIWLVALVVLASWTFLGWFRFPADDRIGVHETPFDRTPGLDPGYWMFLQQVREVLPPQVPFTIRAATAEDEMKLFMIARGVLEEHDIVPTTYYGVPNPGGDAIRWIASYRCEVVPADAVVVSRFAHGCVCERGE